MNRNGALDPDEPLALADIELDVAGEVATTRSTSGHDDPGGPNFNFENVPVGVATVTAWLDGWTTPARVDVEVDADSVTRIDFGRDVPELTGMAWFDEDGDGEAGPSEPPATNLSIRIGQGMTAAIDAMRWTPAADGTFRLPALSPGPGQPGTPIKVTWHGDREYAPVLAGATTDSLSLLWLGPGFGDDEPVAHGFYLREKACDRANPRDDRCLLPDVGSAGVAIVQPSFDHEVRTDAPAHTVLVNQPLTINIEVQPVGPYVAAVYDVFVTMDESIQLSTTPINICNPAGGGPSGDPIIPCEHLAPFIDLNWYAPSPWVPTPPLHLARGDHLYPPCSDPPCHPYDPVSGRNEALALGIVPTRPGRFELIVEAPTTKYGFADRNPANNRIAVRIDVLDQLPGTR